MGNYLDRELSWLQFNYRVLLQADDNNVPLLERLKFLSIYCSNLDEFYMVRVGSLWHRKALAPDYRDPKTAWDASTQLKKIAKAVAEQVRKAEEVYIHLSYDLKASGIEIVDFSKLSKTEEAAARKILAGVEERLSPRIVNSQHPMQFLENCECYLASYLRKGDKKYLGIASLYRIPRYRVLELEGKHKVFLMEDLLCHFAQSIFKENPVKESCILRLTRNADVFVEGEIGAYSMDFREQMLRLLNKRKRQQPLRMQLHGNPSKAFVKRLLEHIDSKHMDICTCSLPFCLDFSKELGDIPGLRYKARRPQRKLSLKQGGYIDYIKEHDLLISYPYQSMATFIDLIYEAADDPRVRSIKLSLYRLSPSSKVAMALAYAAEHGKDVLCLLELRARFDEQNNIDYSELLSKAGCHVIYGLPEYKVHSKLCLIGLEDEEGNESFISLVATGNFNEQSSEFYCDLALLTGDKDIGSDCKAVFDALALGQLPPAGTALISAPLGFKAQIMSLLEEQRLLGNAGHVAIKVNSMNDIEIMDKLNACSQAGCRVELFIRGICCLRPGLPGQSENISVKSVIGRYLEHSRIFVFGQESESQRIYIGSGDLLNRNTMRRVESMVELKDPELRKDVQEIMEAFRCDRESAWEMNPDGTYQRIGAADDSNSQERLNSYFCAPDKLICIDAEKTTEPRIKRLWKRVISFFRG